MSFLETPRFPTSLSYETEGGPEYSTEVLILYSGYEQRNERWNEPLFRFNAATAIQNSTNLYTLLQFFHAVGGKAHGFRFKDPTDYKSCAPSGTISNADQTIVSDATNGQTTAQIYKTYVQGALTRTRSIKKPVANTLVLAKNSVAFTSGWSVDTATGIITFSPALSLHDVITGGYEFDVPVRFDTDKLPTKLIYYLNGEAEVPIVGIRV